MQIITPAQINRILDVTDRLGLHREGVTVPLDLHAEGSAAVNVKGKLEVRAPERDFDRWIDGLPSAIGALDTSRVKRA